MEKVIHAAIAGLGSRGLTAYGRIAAQMPGKIQITAVADPDPEKLERARRELSVPEEMCFSSAEEMLSRPKLANVLFVCTMDSQHHSQALAALEKGYHLLLEKPVSTTLSDCRDIAEAAKKYDRHVVVCHVLRYTPFYQGIKKLLDDGEIGDVVSIQAAENVGYWHQAHSFVRGNWRNSDQSSPMILQKCCHDMDILLWLTGKSCRYVSSYGSLNLFRPENAPEGSALRCLDGCRVKDSCPFDAERFYLDNGICKGKTGWPVDVLSVNPTPESVRRALETGPYGRCVYHCDNNVVDHQVVNLELDGGACINFTMCAFSNRNYRTIHIMGTRGEISGDMEENRIVLQKFGAEPEEITPDLSADEFGHGGGDYYLMCDLVDFLLGEKTDALTTIERSMESHYICFAAEYSRLHQGESVDLREFVRRQ